MNGHSYTDEQIEWLRDNRCQKSKDMAVKFNALFGTNISPGALKGACLRRGILSGADGRFMKMNRPWNRGLKGVNGTSSTTWRKGNRPHNHRPLGSERLSKDGYIEVKTAEPRTWTTKSRVIWERENGPLPDGYAVIFLDGNARNFEPSNLYAVKRRELLQLNRNKYSQAHSKLKPSVLALSKLESALHVASK